MIFARGKYFSIVKHNKTDRCFLKIQQNNKTDTESKNSQIRKYIKIEDYYKTRLTNKTGKTIHVTR